MPPTRGCYLAMPIASGDVPWVCWVEPAVGSLNVVPVHPNAAGERAYADRVMATLSH